jgi:hypothetical protein
LVEIPAAALNGAALLLSAFLTWRLILTYSWATFKRIGANRKVSKAYKLVLTFSVALQLSLFFIVVSMALWIDQLCNGAIGKFAIEMNLYRGIYITVLIFLVPWIVAVSPISHAVDISSYKSYRAGEESGKKTACLWLSSWALMFC